VLEGLGVSVAASEPPAAAPADAASDAPPDAPRETHDTP
jgi:hypothetical protein